MGQIPEDGDFSELRKALIKVPGVHLFCHHRAKNENEEAAP
jgi:hypothetical protein